MSTQENLPQVFEDDSIDLIALLKQIYKGRKLIIVSAVAAAVLGVVVALATPNTYTSGATFIPQTGGEMKTPSGLSGLASLAGINLNDMGGGSDIPPTLYPQITSSVPYRRELLESQINTEEFNGTLTDYLNESYFESSSIVGTLKKYTIGLPGLLLNAFRGSVIDTTSEQITIYRISEEDEEMFEWLDQKLSLTLNEKEGFVTLEFSDEEKYVAAQVAERAKELLQERIIQFRTNRLVSSCSSLLSSTKRIRLRMRPFKIRLRFLKIRT